MSDPIQIRGGAGAELAAAIAAVVSLMMEEESARMATPQRRPELSRWATAGRFASLGRPQSDSGPSGYASPPRR